MKALLFYEVSADGLAKMPTYFDAHKARMEEFNAKGLLLMAGPYGSPPVGALRIFISREAAEQFVSGDPFVINSVVSKHTIYDWTEIFSTLTT
jgi:uncharacterized protein